MTALEKFSERVLSANSLVCVGLDSDFEKLPAKFKNLEDPQFEFNKWIMDETNAYVASYKINIAFYEERGHKGLRELKMTIDHLNKEYPDIFTICDAKRADIGNTNKGYIEEIFDWLEFDAVTLHPYLGSEALAPFLDRRDKVCIILCRTSNKGAGEIQDLLIEGKPLWENVALRVSQKWNKNNNCMLVVGATYPAEIKKVRELVGDMTLLVPGIGTQGGNIKKTLEAGLNSKNEGVIIHSARDIIFSDNPLMKVDELKKSINKYRDN